MPGRSTVDGIFAVRQLVEKFRERGRNLVMVFLDLEKAYDRVPREEMWRCLRKKKVPEMYVRMIMEMYEGCTTTVRSEAGSSNEFEVKVGLHQGSALSPFLFITLLDVLTEGLAIEMPWNILFADDGFLCAVTDEESNVMTEEWREALELRGLRVNRVKTVGMRCNFGEERQVEVDLEIDCQRMEEVKSFKYLGSVVQDDGDLDGEMTNRIKAGWGNWKKYQGFLCDPRVPLTLKGRIQKQVVRPAMLYSAETWATRKKDERRLDVVEMRMLRWQCGLTLKDRVRSEHIRRNISI